jgi:large subunit ribosomal protein L17
MRHLKARRKIGRTSEHRRALFRNQVTSLLDKERIRTTLTKAKELRRIADGMITLGKQGDLSARRRALAFIRDPKVVTKVFDSLARRYAERPGGYTRVLHLYPRPGDRAEMALIELVDREEASPKGTQEKERKGARPPRRGGPKTEGKAPPS